MPGLAGAPVDMVRSLVEQFIEMGAKILPVHPLEVDTRNHVPEVPDHGVDEEQLAVIIPVRTPGVGCSATDDLELPGHRVVAPDGTVELLPAVGRGTRNPHHRGPLDSMTPVEPSIGTPLEAIDKIMPGLGIVPPIQDDLRLPIGYIIPISVRNEVQVRGAESPDASEADLDACQAVPLFPENLALVTAPISIHILQDHDAVAVLEVKVHLALGVGVILSDPQSSTGIKGTGDRLENLRVSSEERGPETRRHLQLPEGLLRCQQGNGLSLCILRLPGLRGLLLSGNTRNKNQETRSCGQGGQATAARKESS